MTQEIHPQGFFSNQLRDLTLSVQSHAPLAAPDASLLLCLHCRTGWEEGRCRQWPLISLPERCGACRDGFVLKNHYPVYIWQVVRGSTMLEWGVDTPHTAYPPQRPKSLHSFSIASWTSQPCIKWMCHPWISMGAKNKPIIES